MGAKIEGRGTRTLKVEGVEKLSPGSGATIPDRIEAGSFLIGAAVTRGCIKTTNMDPTHIEALLNSLREMGCKITIGDTWVEVDARDKKLKPISVKTLPHPGFPTDLQAPMMTLLATIDGLSIIQDTVYTDRFTHVAELQRLGADIKLVGDTAHVQGGKPLSSAPIMASDLRAGAALVLAALIAEGETSISRIYHIDRGYEDFENKINSLGAAVQRTQDNS